MKYKTVYRLEHRKTRRGVYTEDVACNVVRRWLGTTIADERHPMATDDSAIDHKVFSSWSSSHRRFCFSSKRQLRNWFYEDAVLKKLGKVGVVLAVYRVPTTMIGEFWVTLRRLCIKKFISPVITCVTNCLIFQWNSSNF